MDLRAVVVAALALPLLAACASKAPGRVPPEALTVATVRHTAAPLPAPAWVSRAQLPPDTQYSDGERALLLEVDARGRGPAQVESVPLELANLVVRIDARNRTETVVAIGNGSEHTLAFDLFVSPDGERFRAITACPVAPGLDAYERWPERAAWIALANVRVADGGGCR